jgi:hypothetical protein
MKKKMNKFWFCVVLLALVGCSATPSLQEYYVSKSEDPNFLVIDIPTSILGIDNNALTQEEQEALNSFQKLNVLMFRKTTTNAAQLPDELATVRTIINSKNFDPLLMMSDKQYSGKLVLEGTVERPDEIVFFGAGDEGFLLARLIGRDMQVEKAMLLANLVQRGNGLENAAKAIGKMF